MDIKLIFIISRFISKVLRITFIIILNQGPKMIFEEKLNDEFDYVQTILNQGDNSLNISKPQEEKHMFEEQEGMQLKQNLYFQPFQDPYYPNVTKLYFKQTNTKYGAQLPKIQSNKNSQSNQNYKRQKICCMPQMKSNQISKTNKQQYPTKNLLPSFKGSFLNFLASFFSNEQFQDIEIVKRIRTKISINLSDYQDLFRTQAFRPYLKIYFKNKTIYRDLLQSRIEYKTKRNYFKKLSIFQKAFERGIFKKIN